MGGIAPKTFPWPTAIGNSSNVAPLTKSVAPTPLSPTNLGSTGPSTVVPAVGSTSSTPTAPSSPQNPMLPIQPVIGRALSPAFYGL